jgi:hypothetical protein
MADEAADLDIIHLHRSFRMLRYYWSFNSPNGCCAGSAHLEPTLARSSLDLRSPGGAF